MRVLLVGTCLGVGGAERVVVDLADSLCRLGHEVLLVAIKGEVVLRPKEARVGVHCLDARGIGDAFSVFTRLRSLVLSFRPDVVHAHLYHAIVLTRLLRLFVKIPALVTTAHNTKVGGFIRGLLYRMTEPLSDVSTNVSQEAVDAFVRKGAANGRKMIMVHNGISLDEFHRDQGARARIQMELDLSESTRILVAVGRLGEQKDYPNLLRAVALLRQEFSDFVLIIVGKGDLLNDLRGLTRELGIESQVMFLGLRRDVRALLSASDVFVLSSAWEGLPMVVGEAMACECTIVATDCGGPKEFVGDSGFLVPTKDPAALASALARALRLADGERSEIGRQARERIRQHFSLEASVMRWLEIYGLRGRR